ncbi:hypothetical protein A2482_02645 [Candidatus Falkowbacteria bacterium RIFOXYC2_FULL_48_21]|uniref:RNA polymerase sigma factor n=1 Tax=Candidatus Falkowbacteria bacterium RIFOXYC2_FULL_48_21 TaxID=1798005 RepID=A0A1F5TB66_9BACT|nr:MAG: hypothetical protein A2482_02645 [Candidatus Falkowbacteria bacterium RIFOXYC2_FULL_48_21]
MPEKNDAELISRYRRGDNNALSILIARYLKLVFSIAVHYVKNTADAEDITQEVFVRVWKNIKQFDLQKTFKPWLSRITINASLDFLRTKKTISFSQFKSVDHENFLTEIISDQALSMTETLINDETAKTLSTAVNQLPAKDQEIFSLHHDNDWSFREIANKLAEPLNTVKSRYRRALLFLRRLLTKQP